MQTGQAGPPQRVIRAAVCHEFGAPLRVEEIQLRPPAAGEVSVRLAASAICGSDISAMAGAWGGELPAVYGHEAAGIVDEVGDGVAGMRVGDRVVVTLVRFCGRCRLCLRGLPALCEQLGTSAAATILPQMHALDGGGVIHQGLRTGAFAERVTVHASQVVGIGNDIPLESAALLGCGVVTGVGAVLNTAGVEPGSAVGVIGTGGVGLNVVQGAVLAGAAVVLAIDTAATKRDAARRFGATAALDPSEDVLRTALDTTGGRGLDHVIVTAPATTAVELALSLVATAGTVVLVGMPAGESVPIEPEVVAERGLRILGSKVGSTRPHVDIPRLAEFYRSGRLKLDELVSARVSLDEVNDAIALVERGEVLKALIVV